YVGYFFLFRGVFSHLDSKVTLILGFLVSWPGGPTYFNLFFQLHVQKRLFHILYSQSRPAAYGSELITCTIIHPIDEILCRHAGEAV
ncbi:hypothetical protein U6S04_12115, partial [Cutibacterium acnes]